MSALNDRGEEVGTTATRIGEVTLTPEQEPNCVQETNALPFVESSAIAGCDNASRRTAKQQAIAKPTASRNVPRAAGCGNNASVIRGLAVLLGAMLVTLAGSLAASPVAGVGSGLYGAVREGPITPVCPATGSCDAPAQVTLVFRRTDGARHHVYTTRTNANGSYRVALPAAKYAVTTKGRISITRNIRPDDVRVQRGRWKKTNFFIDTGIR